MQPIRWGILGSGNIANQFAQGLTAVEDATIAAVGSRAQQSADAFAAKWGGRAHGSYQALCDNPEVDAIYVATPHSLHRENTLQALHAGKAVLCEKPFALNAPQSQEMIQVARERGVFLMEAMWTRFLPAVARAKALIRDGAIGDLRLVQADFGYAMPYEPDYLVFNPQLGGGALLDVGIYPLSLASFLGDGVESVRGVATKTPLGVDDVNAFCATLGNGALATGASATTLDTPQTAVLLGTRGRIELPSFWHAQSLTLHANGETREESLPFDANGYEYEAREVGRCLREGKRESDVMPLEETLGLMRAMDTLRADWNVRYPDEDAA